MWERSRKAGTFRLFIFNFEAREEMFSSVLQTWSTVAPRTAVKIYVAQKVPLITRKSINFTVNEVINTTNGCD